MSNQREYTVFTTRNGSDENYQQEQKAGKSEDRGVPPIEVLKPCNIRYQDDHLDFYIGLYLRKTAAKQAGYIVQTHRQAEIDHTRVERAGWIHNEATFVSVGYMHRLLDFGERYAAISHPEIASRLERMVGRGLDVLERMPQAGVAIFLRRYGLG